MYIINVVVIHKCHSYDLTHMRPSPIKFHLNFSLTSNDLAIWLGWPQALKCFNSFVIKVLIVCGFLNEIWSLVWFHLVPLFKPKFCHSICRQPYVWDLTNFHKLVATLMHGLFWGTLWVHNSWVLSSSSSLFRSMLQGKPFFVILKLWWNAQVLWCI